MDDNRYTIRPAPEDDVTGCQVLNPSGELVRGVEIVEWIHKVGELPRIRLTVFGKLTDELRGELEESER